MQERFVRVLGFFAVAVLTICVVGCAKKAATDVAAAPYSAEPFGPAECASCGMTLRFQPAPRGQLVHRDGTRAYFCSIGDLVQYAASPSPHGKPQATWVEVQDAAADPTVMNTDPRPWLPANDAAYALGVPRRGVMGPPVVAYGSTADVKKATAAIASAQLLTWTELGPALLHAAEHPNTHAPAAAQPPVKHP